MSQHKTPELEIQNNSLVLHQPMPKLSLDSETPGAEVSGSHEPPESLSHRLVTPGEFLFNSEPIQINNLLIVSSNRRNGLILYKRYHAEFAGPGSAVGGEFDRDCQRALSVGNLSLIRPQSPDELQRAYLIRRQWIRLIGKITDEPVPLRRAQLLLNQFGYYFDSDTITQLPDEALALLVGVLPQTIKVARSTLGNSE
jgi:hypothetical protein